MVEKEIIWSDTAKNQFISVLEYFKLRNGNENYSLKLLSEVEALVVTISKSEQIGRTTSNKFTRVIPFKVYLIFYEVNEQKIEIISFWDNRQNIKKRKIK